MSFSTSRKSNHLWATGQERKVFEFLSEVLAIVISPLYQVKRQEIYFSTKGFGAWFLLPCKVLWEGGMETCVSKSPQHEHDMWWWSHVMLARFALHEEESRPIWGFDMYKSSYVNHQIHKFDPKAFTWRTQGHSMKFTFEWDDIIFWCTKDKIWHCPPEENWVGPKHH